MIGSLRYTPPPLLHYSTRAGGSIVDQSLLVDETAAESLARLQQLNSS